jgi:hypothetical protein
MMNHESTKKSGERRLEAESVETDLSDFRPHFWGADMERLPKFVSSQ